MTRLSRLYIDETGAFDDPAEPAAVVGVLLPGDGFAANASLRQVFETAYAGYAYPPHATELRRPLGVLRSVLSGDGRHALAKAASQRLAPDAVEALTADRRTYRRARPWLEAELGDHPLWEIAAREGRRASQTALRGLEAFAARYPEVAWFAAAVTPSPDPVTGGERYDAALTGLLERVLLVHRGGPPRRIDVVPAQIHREEPSLGGAKRPLMPADVGRVARLAAALPYAAADSVRFVPQLPQRFDRNADPGLVLADLVANRLFQPLRTASTAGELARIAGIRTRLPGQVAAAGLGSGALPTAAAVGHEAELWRAVLERRPPPEVPARPPGWRRDEAATWATSLAEAIR